jgi:hypothetical protein
MDSLYVILLLVVSPFALGVLLTIFLRRVAHWQSRTFECAEFALLSISVLVILVDFISYKEHSELRHLRDALIGKHQTLIPLMGLSNGKYVKKQTRPCKSGSIKCANNSRQKP